MSKKRKLGWIALAALFIFLILYGVHEGFKHSVNDFVGSTIIPQASAAATTVSTSISQTPFYQIAHPFIWMLVGGVALFGIQRLWGRREVKSPMTQVKKKVEDRFQEKPIDYTPEETPQPTQQKPVSKVEAEEKPEKEAAA